MYRSMLGSQICIPVCCSCSPLTSILKSVRVHFAAGDEALRGTHAVTLHNWHEFVANGCARRRLWRSAVRGSQGVIAFPRQEYIRARD